MRSYNKISGYDKCNNLVSYLEYDDDLQNIMRYYNVKGNVLERILTSYSDDEPYFEQMNSVVEYENNIMLFSLVTAGETYMCPILSGQNFTSIEPPNIINTIYSTKFDEIGDSFIENFNMKNDLINEYLNKL
ncbi:MAG: hypothetical protein AABY15_08970 [Nanoarchaeota archaeon]